MNMLKKIFGVAFVVFCANSLSAVDFKKIRNDETSDSPMLAQAAIRVGRAYNLTPIKNTDAIREEQLKALNDYTKLRKAYDIQTIFLFALKNARNNNATTNNNN